MSSLMIINSLATFSQKGAIAVRQPYVRVIGIETIHDDTSGPSAFTHEEVPVKINSKKELILCFN